MEKVLKEYFYRGEYLGKLVFVPSLCGKKQPPEFVPNPDKSEMDFYELLAEMPIQEKLHIQKKAPGVLRLAKFYGVALDEYIKEEELITYAADKGIKNMTQLYQEDRQAWKKVKDRCLEDKLFPNLQKANFREYPTPEEIDSVLLN